MDAIAVVVATKAKMLDYRCIMSKARYFFPKMDFAGLNSLKSQDNCLCISPNDESTQQDNLSSCIAVRLNDSFGTTIAITTSVILIVEGSNELKSVHNSSSYFDL